MYSKLSSVRGYRVVTYVEDARGNRTVKDILNGSVYFTGVGLQQRITQDAIMFSTKEAALAEKFPSNQVGASKGGSGRLPRVLCCFDGWGHSSRRLGGGPATVFEFVKYVGVVKFLDAPHPHTKAQTERPIEPHNFSLPDFTPPLRQNSKSALKKRDETLMKEGGREFHRI